MKATCLYASVAVIVLVTSAHAQNKISGTSKCGKPDPAYALELGDRPNHVFAMSKGSCTWDKPLEIAGIENKGYEDVVLTEAFGARGRMNGFVVSSFANGDKTFVRARGKVTLKDGKEVGSEGSWNYAGGTGKFEKIKGKGTFKCVTEGEGATCTIEGEYELPSK